MCFETALSILYHQYDICSSTYRRLVTSNSKSLLFQLYEEHFLFRAKVAGFSIQVGCLCFSYIHKSSKYTLVAFSNWRTDILDKLHPCLWHISLFGCFELWRTAIFSSTRHFSNGKAPQKYSACVWALLLIFSGRW